MCIIKTAAAKLSSIYQDKQEHSTNSKRKTEGDLEKKIEKTRNDIKEIKNTKKQKD